MFDSSGLLTLHYGKHPVALVDEIREWFEGEYLADLALVCEGRETLRAHRLVLASSSPLIKQVLQETPTVETPVTIQLPGVRASDMKLLLHFLYTGETYVQSCDVEGVRELIQLLQIKSDFLDKQCRVEPKPPEEKDPRQSESSELSREGPAQPSKDETSNVDKNSSHEVPAVTVKKEATEENDEEEDNEEEEDENEKEGEDEETRKQQFVPARRRSSLNPVNLSLTNPDQDSNSPRSPPLNVDPDDSSDVVERDSSIKVCLFFIYFTVYEYNN
ncbi:hypothetical protein C0J52_27466 [Blattella germanica]|nr:hypothetical protein C0J52_27466 [Blattella germanica]